jgi:hypothetical protein
MTILIIATIFILLGVSAAIGMLIDAASHRIMINLNLCCALVGIGLLRGKESSLKWARLWAHLYLIPALVLLFFIPTMAVQSQVYQLMGLAGTAYFAVCYGTVLAVIVLCSWVIHALTVEKCDYHPLL